MVHKPLALCWLHASAPHLRLGCLQLAARALGFSACVSLLLAVTA